MLIEDSEVNKRLNNPLNLMNRLRAGISAPVKKNAMDLFIRKDDKVSASVPVKSIPENSPPSVNTALNIVPPNSQEAPLSSSLMNKDNPSSDDLIEDADSKVKLALAHDSAIDLLTSSISKLKKKIDDDEIKASSIPSIISSASRVITDIRKERLEREKTNDKQDQVHYHFYCPEQKKLTDYEVIEVVG